MKASKCKKEKKAIRILLKNSSKSEQELVEKIVNEDVSRKQVTRALARLIEKGEIVKSDGHYSLAGKSSESSSEPVMEEEALPFAEILRRKKAKETVDSTESAARNEEEDDKVDIDDEIKRLEAELAADDDETDGGSEDDSDDERTERDKRVSFGAVDVREIESSRTESRNMEGDAVVCLSAVAQDRITPLPESCLPKTKKRTLQGIDDDPQQKKPKKSNVSSGLRDAVKEVLSGYVARSSERLPFYCRVCAKQYTNEQEFFEHKSTDFHTTAMDVERKASFCKLCRKQFTSPVQLKEHISSRPHKDRLEHVRSRQWHSNSNGGRRNGGEGQSRRQWC